MKSFMDNNVWITAKKHVYVLIRGQRSALFKIRSLNRGANSEQQKKMQIYLKKSETRHFRVHFITKYRKK